MTLTTAQAVRLKIQDLPAVADDTYYGDGLASTFALPHRNLTSGTAYVSPGGTAWSATGATFDATGFVAFSAALSANSGFRTRYVYSVFSDDEINHMITAGGGILGAALEAVQALMFDSLKRASWSAPDGTRYDDTAAQRTLLDMYKALKAEQQESAADSGGFESWTLNQELYE